MDTPKRARTVRSLSLLQFFSVIFSVSAKLNSLLSRGRPPGSSFCHLSHLLNKESAQPRHSSRMRWEMKKLAKKSQLAVESTSLLRGNRKCKTNLWISKSLPCGVEHTLQSSVKKTRMQIILCYSERQPSRIFRAGSINMFPPPFSFQS